ncbi:MAG: aminotransferase class V-fold PLP-dependent enzyme [Spirochaetaceae bacterium]
MLDNKNIKLLFPFLQKDLIYFDSAATSLKPQTVLDAQTRYYTDLGINTGRGTSLHTYKTTSITENIRYRISEFIGSTDQDQIIFTSNTTDSINMVVNSYISNNLNKKSNIVITGLEHHSNYVPWIELAKNKNIECRIAPLQDYKLDPKDILNLVDENTIITSITGMSNLTGQEIDLEMIIEKCHEKGSKILVDAAQLINHRSINVTSLDIDFLVFSTHKIYGTFGLGILYGKKELLDQFTPTKYGGNMVSYITNKTDVKYKDIPTRLESGTQNPAAIYAFNSVLDFLEKYPIFESHNYTLELGRYLISELKKETGIIIYSVPGAIISFNIEGIHPHDASEFFDNNNILLRTGNLCASPFFTNLSESGVIRVSLGIYNNKSEIDILINTIKEIKEFFL